MRMEVYEKSTRPLTDFYRQRGLLVTVEAEGTPEEIYQRTLTALDSVRSGGKTQKPVAATPNELKFPVWRPGCLSPGHPAARHRARNVGILPRAV